MKIKSWHLIFIGIFLQALVSFIMLAQAKKAESLGGLVITIISVSVLFFSFFGIIPLLLLVFKKTRNIGGIISILFGVIGLILKFGFIIGIFSILAGVLALWKKI